VKHSLERFTEYHPSPKLPIAVFAYLVVIVHFQSYGSQTQNFFLGLLVQNSGMHQPDMIQHIRVEMLVTD
jgi:hypothetical protein